LNTISVHDLAAQGECKAVRIDVRSGSEYASGHIPGAMNIPLEQIEKRVADLSTDRPIALICQTGQRARVAATLLQPCGTEFLVVEGGTKAWRDAGLPLVASVKARWSLERQVRLIAGLLVFSGSLLAALVSPYWLIVPAFVGCGLSFAGATDICPMGLLLARLPWNHESRCDLSTSGGTQAGAA
jgi:rhodanese-related sulfurtransferase